MPVSIMLDAGHGGRDPGAVYNGRQEKDDTLALTLAIGEILQGRGIDVLYTRTTDVYESPYQKAMEANEAGVDFFVSIHRNSYPTDNTVSGVETLVYDKSGIKLQMAENINEQLEAVGFVNLGVKERPGLVVLRRTRMPAVLVEVGFINSDIDNKLFDDNFDDIALAIAEGILDTLQMNGLIDTSQDAISGGEYENVTATPPQGMVPPVPGAGMPGGFPGGQPGGMPGTQPGGMPGSQPGGMPGTQPGGMPGSQPGGMPGSQPGGMPGTQPGGMPGSQPGGMPGSQPGGMPGPRPENRPDHTEGMPQYTVQTGAFRNASYAQRLQRELTEQDFPASIEQGDGLFRVMVGMFPTLDEAVDMERRLKRAGYQTVVLSR